MKNASKLTAEMSHVADRRLLWLAIVLVGAVFFFVGHDFQVSRYERFAPWSDADGALQAGGNVLKGLALALIGLIGLYFLLRPDGRPLRMTGWLPAIMVFYLAWSAVSILWSSDQGLSCRRLAVLVFCVLGALGFARQFRPRDVVLMAMSVSAAYLVVGVAAELALGTFQPWRAGYRFAGTVHPNMQGAHLTVLCLASFCLAWLPKKNSRRRRTPPHCNGRVLMTWMLFAVGLIFLLLTKSRTSCASLAIVLSILWLVNVSGRARALAAAAAGFVICTAALAGSLFGLDVDGKIVHVAMLGRGSGAEALTGRIPIWTELLRYVRDKPLAGYGYESFWIANRIEAVSDEMHWPLREAHNAYVDAALSVGLIGTAALLAIVSLGLCWSVAAYRRSADPGFAFTICMLVFGLLNACLETGMGGPNFITLMAGGGVAQLLSLRSRNDEAAGYYCL